MPTEKDYIIISSNLISFCNEQGITNYAEIVLLAKIITMSKAKGYCYASNQYFMDLLKVSKRSIERYITDLRERGLIRCTYRYEGKQIVGRTIYLQDATREM